MWRDKYGFHIVGPKKMSRAKSAYTGKFLDIIQGYSQVPPGFSNSTAQQPKTDTAERSISIGRESLQVFFVLGALAYFQVPPLGGSREEKWRSP